MKKLRAMFWSDEFSTTGRGEKRLGCPKMIGFQQLIHKRGAHPIHFFVRKCLKYWRTGQMMRKVM
jgi:hypothetical protein